MEKYQLQIDAYAESLDEFLVGLEALAAKCLDSPDHIAFKAADAAHFDQLIIDFKSLSEHISCVEMDGRRLATAKLLTPLVIGQFGEVSWVELMEPRPEKVGHDVVGFEHMEFTQSPPLREVAILLEQLEVPYQKQSNPGHSWLNVVINSGGQELKLNDKALGQTVLEEMARGEGEVIYQA